jgi:group I intron endonuclease
MDNVAHLYRITNTKTGEYYVGKHRGVTQETRWGNMYWGSGTRILNQVKKYGTENFKYEILCISNTDYIFELESKYVTKELLQEDKLCLNIVTGGREPPSKKGNVISEETRQKLIGRTPWNKGGTFSEETKKKMSESALGRKHSEETKEKFRNRIVWNAGKTGVQIGANKGRCWMNDGQKTYRIRQEEIEMSLQKGLVMGFFKKKVGV